MTALLINENDWKMFLSQYKTRFVWKLNKKRNERS